ncbi:r3h domain protein [Sporothrix brasiliensis 5110]|uniref:R3h domain protein n=1 Tax=Sporothrix brasiliensis 5110 TaxID=1398154 RepID=A0A0C2F831_9PEZI|nr:r3h domain protein [Sporothrix brasiliensis 5110]KIH95174.1 r3h domain protein [Sporothrix brasiliensis 5110]
MNAQQPQGEYYNGYGGPMNHSPNPTRPGYATVGISALNGGRRSQPSGEPGLGQQASLLFSEDRFGSFEPSQRFDRNAPAQSTLQPPGAYNMFAGANQSAWNYSAGAAATMSGPMSGPMNDGSRIRASSRRPALHPEWTTNEPPQLGTPNGQGMPFYSSQQHLVGQQAMGLPSTSSPDPFTVQPPSVNLQAFGPPEIRTMSDSRKDMGDLIPTAIVIKNIPFNVRKEYLTTVMIDMHLPQPYAFNYHFDQGVFRGLAFANFQSAADTKLVIDRMNGLDIQGRKLRVEYKKMLPEHERERIEREKREKRGQLEEQHRGPTHQISMSSLATATSAQRTPLNEQISFDPSAAVANSRLDLNDPHQLRFYLELYMFHNDDSREVHIFPTDTSPEDRRLIHILAHNMGLEHTSIGEGDNRQVHVSKAKFSNGGRQSTVQQPGVTLDGHPRGLSRAATYDFNDRQQPSVHSMNRGPTLAIPNSPENHQQGLNGLRGVKSFADLRSYSPSPSPSLVSSAALGNAPTNGHNSGGAPFLPHFPSDGPFGPSLTTPTTPGSAINPQSSSVDASGLVNSLGSLGLGSSSYDSSVGLSGRPRETPGAIGAIGSQRPSANGNSTRGIPERQPRGPGDWEKAGGFTRGRSNGHMQRSSGMY